MAAQMVEGGHHPPSSSSSPPSPAPASTPPALDRVEKTKTLICALNLLSRNLPLPADVFASVSSIFHGGESGGVEDVVDNEGDPSCFASGGGEESRQLADEAAELASDAKKDSPGVSSYRDLIMEFEDSVVRQRPSCMTAAGIIELKESRLQSQVDRRLQELEAVEVFQQCR